MKRLAAVAVTVALMVGWPSCGAFAQHGGGGSHGGGFSGGGFSGSHAGFSGPAGGFSGRSAPAFHGGFSAAPRSGFSRPAPPMSPRMYGAPARYAPSPSSYRAFPGSAVRPTGGPRMPSTTGTYRAPYHSSYGDHNHGYGYHYPHNHVVIVSSVWPYWGWGYPYGYGWGYPYYGLGYSSFFNDSDNYDSQQPAYYAAPQDYYNVPYQQQQPEDQQQQQQPPESYPQQPQQPVPQQPSGSRAPYSGAQAPPPGSQALTVVFKDGRPPEHVYNYLLTANTLTVLDQNRHDIPVDEINLEATAQVNIQAGVEFSLPVRTP